MKTIFMNTEISKINESLRFRLTLADKLNLKDPNKNMVLANLSIYYTWENIKSAYSNNNFKISAPAWNDEFGLPGGSCSISDIQYYFEYIIKNMKLQQIILLSKFTPIKSKTGYKLKLLSPETIKLLGGTKKDLDQDKDGDDVPKLESVEVVLVHCNLVNNNYQQAS